MTYALIEPPRRLGWVDMTLVAVYLLGIYLGVAIQITSTIPFPAAPSGVAGLILLWRRRDQIVQSHLVALLVVILLYLASILSATDYSFLGKRFTGLVQLTYSLIIAYALFITLMQAGRRQIAGLFLGFALVILAGALLEDYAGLRQISDSVRLMIYDYGIYDADLRDQILYGRIRPKVFTSEPSAVTFGYTLFCFGWLITSRWRWKLLGYLALAGAALFALPGPTLLLLLVLAVPFELFVDGRSAERGGRGVGGLVKVLVCVTALVVGGFVIGTSVFAARLHDISSGTDASFFFREIGPALTAFDVMQRYPFAGAGLTGEPFIANEVINVFMRSPEFSAAWDYMRVGDVLVNYFWLHWIYLGLVWGTIMAVALTVWLKVLDVPSVLFCWAVWIVLGQASGAYVSPKTWTVLFLAAAASALRQRSLSVPAMAEDPELYEAYAPPGGEALGEVRWSGS
jgi:hypothetical protein